MEYLGAVTSCLVYFQHLIPLCVRQRMRTAGAEVKHLQILTLCFGSDGQVKVLTKLTQDKLCTLRSHDFPCLCRLQVCRDPSGFPSKAKQCSHSFCRKAPDNTHEASNVASTCEMKMHLFHSLSPQYRAVVLY